MDIIQSNIGNILYIAAFIAICYFLLIRPQQKKQKEALKIRESIKYGDKITTIGGIKGKVTKVKEDSIELETGSSSDKKTITLAKWAIGTIDNEVPVEVKDTAEAIEKE